MKKILSFISNQEGFVLPYVLFFAALALFVVIASTDRYSNDVQITHNQIEQIRIETLVQMGRAKLLDELAHIPQDSPITYSFPDGVVEISIISIKDNQYNLHLNVTTSSGSVYDTTNTLTLIENNLDN
ncbi:competence type IV pilus minor pilin ComGG [Virgibacillus byunsanensis]|uniref:Competence type IV pilus minor pilin ComGG n=1 Tax=Virgibacillus byunsanensis TaxID=570945 RepID=A0ABW3LJI3_9BACI